MFGLSTDYVVEFDIAAIILTLMLLYTLFMRRTFPTKAILQYKFLLVANLVASVTDVISAYTLCNIDNFSIPFNYFINIVYLFAHNITGVFFMLYVIAAIRGNLGTKVERVSWISIVAIVSVTTLTTPITHAIIYFDAENAYCHGGLFFVLYVLAGFTLVYSTVLFLTHRSMMSSFQLATDFAFVVLIAGALLFQSANPYCLVENFIVATACLMMNVAMDNPATYFYQSTSCYNQSAFNMTMEAKLESKAEFVLAAFTFDDLSVFRKQYTEKDYEALILKTIQRCHEVGGSKKVFILQDATFVFMHEKGDADQLIYNIETSVTRPVSLPCGKEITVAPHFCLLQFPGEAQTVNEVNLVIQDMLTHIYRKTGRHVIWDSTKLLAELRREDAAIHALRDAIRNNGIRVQYQPIFNHKTGTFSSAEALVQLRDNPLGLYPDEFIPIAEQNGLILDIGEQVLDTVCRFLQESRCEDFGIDHINVNLSMLQLVRKSAVERLVDICRSRGVAPGRIVFEVTETATESGEDNNVPENINYLKEQGFSLSLDDYGSGYSNMTHLLRFPFDQIKLDKSLLWDAVKDEDSREVLENMVKLVRGFQKTCVVEGVENEEMERLLVDLDVDLLQGYKYSKPISPISLLAFLKEKNI